MLYDQWRAVAAAHAGELALRDVAQDRSWTFAQLARDAESRSADAWVFPAGRGAEFVLEVLAGWRHGRVVCPVESRRDVPDGMASPPSGVMHVKRTSATSGPPRSILFTGEQLAQDAVNIVATMGLDPRHPNLGVISLAHSYGFSNLVLPLLLHGIPLYLADSPIPERLRRLLDLRPRWTLPGVPALWRAWVDVGILADRVALAISAGAPLPLTLEREAYAGSGLKIHNFYGASECGGIAYDDSMRPRTEDHVVGRPLQGVQVTTGDHGCLEIRGSAVATGYWPEESPGNLGAGCYRSQDLGEVVEGWVHLKGRAGDLINVAGRKVNPDQLEAVLLRAPGLRDCLIFGVERPQSRRGEEIVICYVADASFEEKTCRAWAAARLPDWQVPRHWWRVPLLEGNERGKRSRKHWRERFLQEQEGAGITSAC